MNLLKYIYFSSTKHCLRFAKRVQKRFDLAPNILVWFW